MKVGLEATGHYSCNILGFLHNKGLSTIVINPLYTSLRRKSISLRKTKTDKADARTIASMIMSDVSLNPYSDTLYHNEDLKSLSRYRFDKVSGRAKLKQSVSRLVNILFPKLEKLVSTLHTKAVYELLSEFPGAHQVASANLKHLTALLISASKGHFDRDRANEIREAARRSVSSYLPAKSLELRHTIKLIRELNAEIAEIETEIKKIMDSIDSPTLSVPGISYALGTVIVSDVGDFSRFDNPDKLLAFAGCSPSTYQSGQIYSTHAKMEKRGSGYLRWALLNAAKYVCKWEPTFAIYLRKKRAEGKHYKEHPALIIDPETAPVVLRFFEMYASGIGIRKICSVLESEKILSPAVYEFRKTGRKGKHPNLAEPYLWAASTMRDMLSTLVYCGDTVNFQTYSKSNKLKKRIKNSPDKMMTFQNTREAIVNRKLFDTVQKHFEGRKRPSQ